MKPPLVWVTGAYGLLGRELLGVLREAGFEAIGSGREVSVLDEAALRAFMDGKDISWMVNCAAYTKVDEAERELESAFALNAEAPGRLARLAREKGVGFIQLSTDYVFNGASSRPYREDDPVDPLSIYGKSKAEGEGRVLSAYPEALVVRTSWLYGGAGPSFPHRILEAAKKGSPIRAAADQTGSPTWTRSLARALTEIMGLSIRGGLYHYADRGGVSRCGQARHILDLAYERGMIQSLPAVEAVSSRELGLKAARPAYSVLASGRLERLGIGVESWERNSETFLAGLAEA